MLAQQLNRAAGAAPLGSCAQGPLLTKCLGGRTAGSALGFGLLADMLKRGRRPGKPFFDALVKALCVEGRASGAREIFEAVHQMGCPPDSTSCLVLVGGLCVARHTTTALTVLREMMVRGRCSGRDASMFSIVVKCLCSEGYVGDALTLVREMNMVGLYPSITAYDTLVRALCGTGNAIVALKVLKGAMVHGNCRRFGVATYNVIIDGLLKDGHICDALWLVEKLNAVGILPDIVTCNIVIRGLCRTGNSSAALKVFETMVMQKGHCMPNDVTHCVLIDGLCKEGLFGDALRAIQDMEAIGISLDIMMYHTLIKHLCRIGNTKLAIELIREMTLQGNCSKPGTFMYNMIVKRLCEEGYVSDALLLIGEMEDAKISPNIITYNNLVMGLCKIGNMSMAIELLREKTVVVNLMLLHMA